MGKWDDDPGSLDVELYPDLIESGGLSLSLARLFRSHGFEDIASTITTSAGDLAQAFLELDRGGIWIGLGAEKRLFFISIARSGYVWTHGVTSDLHAVVGAVEAWVHGASLAELNARFPFMEFDELAAAYERGNPIPVQWSILFKDADLIPIRPLLHAAHANARLQNLFPYVTHLALLRLAKDPEDRTKGEIWITQRRDSFEVEIFIPEVEESSRIVQTIEEAVDLAAVHAS